MHFSGAKRKNRSGGYVRKKRQAGGAVTPHIERTEDAEAAGTPGEVFTGQ